MNNKIIQILLDATYGISILEVKKMLEDVKNYIDEEDLDFLELIIDNIDIYIENREHFGKKDKNVNNFNFAGCKHCDR